MKCPKKARYADRLVHLEHGSIGRLSFNPGNNTPEPRISTARDAYTYWGRDRNWNLLGEARQPCLLVPNKIGRNSAARDADGELRSKPKNGIVPARVNGCDVKRGQSGMLCLQQCANQTFIDLDFCGWGTRLYGGVSCSSPCQKGQSIRLSLRSRGGRAGHSLLSLVLGSWPRLQTPVAGNLILEDLSSCRYFGNLFQCIPVDSEWNMPSAKNRVMIAANNKPIRKTTQRRHCHWSR